MVSKLRNLFRKQKDDNEGAAIVIVIVAIAFIGMLIAMLVYMAYYNYLMKHLDKSAKDNFYTAEYALDALNAGLQKDVSKCMSEAYIDATRYSSELDKDSMTINFKRKFVELLIDELQYTPADEEHWNKTHFTDMWTEANVPVAAYSGNEGAYLEFKGDTDSTKCKITKKDTDYITLSDFYIVYTDKKGFISIISTDIRLKVPDVDFAKSASKLPLDSYSLIANTKLVDDKNDTTPIPTTITGVSKGATSTSVTGSVYGGKDGTYIANIGKFEMVKDADDISAGRAVDYLYTAHNLNVENVMNDNSTNMFVIGDSKVEDRVHTLDVDNIVITSSKFNSYAKTNIVGNDMDIQGRNSVITIESDAYTGYGNSADNANESSAILINGGNTTLNFSKLKSLNLSGRAFVGAKKYDVDKDRLAFGVSEHEDVKDVNDSSKVASVQYSEEQQEMLITPGDLDDDKVDIKDIEWYQNHVGHYNLPRGYENTNGRKMSDASRNADGTYYVNNDPETGTDNGVDPMLGESISVKANQLLYMIPDDYVGVTFDKHEVTQYSHNPMTYEEYLHVMNDMDSSSGTSTTEGGQTAQPGGDKEPKHLYSLVGLESLWQKINNGVAITHECVPVFRRINGQVMVYLYFNFGANENLANDYFEKLYKYDPEGVDTYFKSYIKEFSTNSTLNANLSLAGNAFNVKNGKFNLVDDDLENSKKVLKMGTMQEDLYENHQANLHMLGKSYDLLSSTELANDLYDNLVDETAFNAIVAYNKSVGARLMAGTTNFENPLLQDGTAAVISDEDVVYPRTEGGVYCPTNTNLIVCSKDVYLTADYSGLVIAKGNIYICTGTETSCSSIRYNSSKVIDCMRKEIKVESLKNADGNYYHVYDIFGENGRVTYGVVEKTEKQSGINISDLIAYQNWKKE